MPEAGKLVSRVSTAYAVRIAGLWIAVVLVALALPSVSYRILASAGAAQD